MTTEHPSIRTAPDEPLPGMGPEPAGPGAGRNELQARRTLSKLVELGYIGEEHAGQMELYLTLAATVDRVAQSGRAGYTIAQCAKEMRELYESFIPEDVEGEAASDADFERWRRQLLDVDTAGGTP